MVLWPLQLVDNFIFLSSTSLSFGSWQAGQVVLQGGKSRSINRFVKGYDRLVDMFEGLIHLKKQKDIFSFITQAKK
jgi:hypothetical protein